MVKASIDREAVMFRPLELFRRSSAVPELTTLHLETPPPVPAAIKPTFEERTKKMREILEKSPANEEITRHVKALVASDSIPEETFFLVLPNGQILTLSQEDPGSFALLLFSSVLLATDYLRATKVDARIAGVRLADLHQLAPAWKKAGVSSFVMNKCPRCVVYVALKSNEPLTALQLGYGWAVNRAVRTWRARELVNNFLGQSENRERRATLELLRDHVDCEVPYVHWMIALLAGMDGDEPARLAATERLAEFGPQFEGKTDVCLDEEDAPRWARCLAEATLGLTMHFGVVQLPQTTMVQ